MNAVDHHHAHVAASNEPKRANISSFKTSSSVTQSDYTFTLELHYGPLITVHVLNTDTVLITEFNP
jgi:hypothetical protein